MPATAFGTVQVIMQMATSITTTYVRIKTADLVILPEVSK